MSLCLKLCLLASPVTAQDVLLEWFPIRPFNFDMAFSQRTFAPDNRVIGIQGGITALRYGDLEVRAIYQYYSNHTLTFQTDQNSLYLNPRWNNFIDILDFPRGCRSTVSSGMYSSVPSKTGQFPMSACSGARRSPVLVIPGRDILSGARLGSGFRSHGVSQSTHPFNTANSGLISRVTLGRRNNG